MISISSANGRALGPMTAFLENKWEGACGPLFNVPEDISMGLKQISRFVTSLLSVSVSLSQKEFNRIRGRNVSKSGTEL